MQDPIGFARTLDVDLTFRFHVGGTVGWDVVPR